jgi:hypothetical protein
MMCLYCSGFNDDRSHLVPSAISIILLGSLVGLSLIWRSIKLSPAQTKMRVDWNWQAIKPLYESYMATTENTHIWKSYKSYVLH